MSARRGAKLTNDAGAKLSSYALTLPAFLKDLNSDQDDLFAVDFEITKSVDGADGAVMIEGFLNTSNLDDDLDGDIVEPRAFERDIAHFMKHPIIRREHKHPIGRVMRVEFRPEGPWFEGMVTHDAPGEQTRDMIRKKILRGISAQFKAQPKADHVELLPKGEGRFRIKRARLLEVTVTDVPRNSGGHFNIKDSTRAMFQKSLGGGAGKSNQKENEMEFLKLVAQLLRDAGYACDADNQLSVMKALGDAISAGKGASALALIAKSLGKSESASADELISALKTATSKDGTVAKSVHDELVKKASELEVELLLLRNASRITPANREFAKSLAATDAKMFEQWLPTQPEVPGARLPSDTSPPAPDKKTGLSETDLQIAKSFGVKEEDLKKSVAMLPFEISSQLFGQPINETDHDRVLRTMNESAWGNV